jgi:hypothetical protein
MRTTVTLDPDTVVAIRRRMADRKVSFKQALNDAIREGIGASQAPAYRTPERHLGKPTVSLDRALQLAAELEDDALIARMRAGS